MTCLKTMVVPMIELDESGRKKVLMRCLKVGNLLISMVGIAILLYGTRMFIIDSTPSWFLSATIGAGSTVCIIALIGYIAAASRIGFFLIFYMLLLFLFFLAEILVVSELLLNPGWKTEIPADTKNRFDDFMTFAEAHSGTFKLIGSVFLTIQVISFFIAMYLKKKYTRQQAHRINHDEQVSVNVPFLNHQVAPLPYAVGHPHPTPDHVVDTTLNDKGSMPYTEREIWIMAGYDYPPY